MKNNRVRMLMILAIFNITFLAIGVFGSIYHRTWMTFGIGSIVIVTFVGMIYIQKENQDKTDLRFPIATTIALIYLLMVVTWGVYQKVDDFPLMTAELIYSFSAITAIVIVFYFGSSAYLEKHRRRNRDNKEIDKKEQTK